MRRFLSSILALLIIFTTIPDMANAQGTLLITSSKTIAADSGETVRIPITIENFGSGSDRVVVRAEVTDPTYMYISGSQVEIIEDGIGSGDSEDVSFRVKIDGSAPKGTYPLTIIIIEENMPPQQEQVFVRVESVPAELNIAKTDIYPADTVTAGENFNIAFEIENLGDTTATDIRLSLEGLSENGFSLTTGSNNVRIKEIDGGKSNYAVFQLKADKNMNNGTNTLKLNIEYDGVTKEIHDVPIKVVANRNKDTSLVIENISYPTGTLKPNTEVVVSFQLRNKSALAANNIEIKGLSQDTSGLVDKTLNQVDIDTLAPGAVAPISFKFVTTNSGMTKNYPIELNVEYEEEGSAGDMETVSELIGVFLQEKDEDDDENLSTPKLIIDKYSFQPDLVKAGENFTMTLSFFNTNSSKSVKNIKIFLTSDEKTDPNSNSSGGSVFTPVNSSNTFYIDSIPPKGRVEKKITMFTVPDALAKTYTMTANFEYEDSDANPYTATELIGVPVVQQSKLELGELSIFPEAYMGQSTPISLEFYNTGKVTLYNMMVKLEGDFQVENAQTYIGNFDSGGSEFFEGYAIPNATGEVNGAVVFSYEDSTGQMQEIRKEFTLNVMEAPPMPEFPDGMPIEEPQSGGILKSKIFWGIVIAAAAITGIVFYKKKKKKKEEAMEIDE